MNTRQLERLRPYHEIDTAFTRHQKAKNRLKNLAITVIVTAALILAASWIIPEVTAIWESRAQERYKEIHKIVLDGRGPALKRVAKEALRP